jgi:nondiscriminating glutamyl-tRNA synthetase
MHVGNFRTALYTYLFAKKNGGEFLLRIEDTDKNRFVENSVENIINLLEWSGLEYSEGVFVNSKFQIPSAATDKQNSNFKISKSITYPDLIEVGDFGPYIQSERLDIYKEHVQKLIENGTAYYCFCTENELEIMRNEQVANKQAPMYDRRCLKLSPEEIQQKIAAGEKYVIRQKINTAGITKYIDLIRGEIEFKNELLDDQILMKSDGYPTYNFANVVDDHLMNISHVLRGEEYVSSTPKYIQLYQNFGWEVPEFAHLPLLLNPDKTKLSKRQGDVAVEDYIKKGYLKEAIINFVALLGWNLGEGSTQEMFTLQELEQVFDIKRVHKAGAVFDLKKLDWLNAQYIKKLSIDELYKNSLEFFVQKEFYQSWIVERESWSAEEKEKYLKKVLQIEQDRLNNLSEVGENNQFFFTDIIYNKEMLLWKTMTDSELQESLEKSIAVLTAIDEDAWEIKNIEEKLFAAAGDKKGDLLWPLRVALSGAQKSPSPMELAWVLGKAESLRRLKKALA